MTTPNEGEARLEFVRRYMSSEFGATVHSIKHVGRGHNNFVYRVEILDTFSSSTSAQHGTVSIPHGAKEVIMRISNPAANLNEEVRIENEVAAMVLMRDALSGHGSKIVPDVYGWGSGKNATGFIIEEKMGGEPLQDITSLGTDVQKQILSQAANIFKLIQSYQLPGTIDGYGGLNFDEKGNVVLGPTSIHCGGPFSKYEDMYRTLFQTQMDAASICPQIPDREGNGVRARLARFLQSDQIGKIVSGLSETKQTLVHGDFVLFNMLFDPITHEITALLDFDLAHVGSPADEFLYSFSDMEGLLFDPFNSDTLLKLREYVLTGFPDGPPDVDSTPADDEPNWQIAKVWDDSLAELQVLRPKTIEGIEEMSCLHWFCQDVCAPYLTMQRWLVRQTPERIENAAKEVDGNVVKYLERWGF